MAASSSFLKKYIYWLSCTVVMAHFPCRHRFKQLIKLSGSDGGKPTVTFADQLFLQKNHRHKADRDRGDGIGQIMFHFTTPLK